MCELLKLQNFIQFSAVQHERKPILDKKETASTVAGTTNSTNASSGGGGGGGGSASTGNTGSSATGSNASTNSVNAAAAAALFTQNCSKSFWRNDFGVKSAAEAGAASIPNLSIFPVGFNFAELTSTLAQRGSKCFFFLCIFSHF